MREAAQEGAHLTVRDASATELFRHLRRKDLAGF